MRKSKQKSKFNNINKLNKLNNKQNLRKKIKIH